MASDSGRYYGTGDESSTNPDPKITCARLRRVGQPLRRSVAIGLLALSEFQLPYRSRRVEGIPGQSSSGKHPGEGAVIFGSGLILLHTLLRPLSSEVRCPIVVDPMPLAVTREVPREGG